MTSKLSSSPKYRPSMRFAIGFVLGIGIGKQGCGPSKSMVESQNSPATVKTSQVSGDPKRRDSSLVPEDCFDEDPLRYVDVSQCRELIFKITGREVAITDEEVEAQCADLKERQDQAHLDHLAQQLCISDPDDEAKIEEQVRDGYVEFESLAQHEEDKDWVLELRKPGNDYPVSLYLNQEPSCRPGLTSAEKEMAEKRKKSEERWKALMEGEFKAELEEVDVERMKGVAKELGVEHEFKPYFEQLEALKKIDTSKVSDREIEQLCRFISISFRLTNGSGLNLQQMVAVAKDPLLDGGLRRIDNLAVDLAEALKLSGLEDCVHRILEGTYED